MTAAAEPKYRHRDIKHDFGSQQKGKVHGYKPTFPSEFLLTNRRVDINSVDGSLMAVVKYY